MQIKYSKYHGLGNDFIIVYDLGKYFNYSSFVQKICNRHTGIGADGLMVVLDRGQKMAFYNQDGSLGTMCGNGLRCFSKFLIDEKLINENKFIVNTTAGNYNVEAVGELIKIEFGDVSLDPKLMDIDTNENRFFGEKVLDSICYAAYSGTSHLIVFVEDFGKITEDYANRLHKHPNFRSKINVNFVQVINNRSLKIKTYERGVGFTLACGTGAIASFMICRLLGKVDAKVVASYVNGDLILEEKNNLFYFIGPAVKIADGTYYYN